MKVSYEEMEAAGWLRSKEELAKPRELIEKNKELFARLIKWFSEEEEEWKGRKKE